MAEIDSRIGHMLVRSSKTFEAATIENASELVAFADAHGSPIVELAEGYWGSIRAFWADLEIEIFADHLEIYPDGDPIRVWYEDHRPGDSFSDQWLDALRPRAGP